MINQKHTRRYFFSLALPATGSLLVPSCRTAQEEQIDSPVLHGRNKKFPTAAKPGPAGLGFREASWQGKGDGDCVLSDANWFRVYADGTFAWWFDIHTTENTDVWHHRFFGGNIIFDPEKPETYGAMYFRTWIYDFKVVKGWNYWHVVNPRPKSEALWRYDPSAAMADKNLVIWLEVAC
jgi:hypothetical protein